jgi:hypothetical protein
MRHGGPHPSSAINVRPDILNRRNGAGKISRIAHSHLSPSKGLGTLSSSSAMSPWWRRLEPTVVLRVQPSLVRLLSSIYSGAITVVSTESDEGSDAEWQCPSAESPSRVWHESRVHPRGCPYLLADLDCRRMQWAQRLSANGLRVGLVWAGNPKHTRDRQRSIALGKLSGLTRMQGATFYSLQKGAASTDLASSPLPIVDLSEHLEDFAVTAADYRKPRPGYLRRHRRRPSGRGDG